MIRVTARSDQDASGDIPMVDAYMRWALEAAQAVIGPEALLQTLREAGLERFIHTPPTDALSASGAVTFRDYAAFHAALLRRFGPAIALRIGQLSVRRALQARPARFMRSAAASSPGLTTETRLKLGLMALLAGLSQQMQSPAMQFEGAVEDRGDHWAVVVPTCPVCAGQQADGCIGWLVEALLAEAGRLVFGLAFNVVEVACRAQGDPAGVWLVPKRPNAESLAEAAAARIVAALLPDDDLVLTDRAEPDRALDLYLLDAYMRWALLAVEAIVGAEQMPAILRHAGLERLIDNYPPDHLEISGQYTFRDYARLNASLLDLFGRGAANITHAIGRLSARLAMQRQFELFNLSQIIASQTLPPAEQVKLGLEAMHQGFRQLMSAAGQDWHGHVEDRGVCLAFVVDTCPLCAGKQANIPLGGIFEGLLAECVYWLTGQRHAVREVQCRAMGAHAGVWEISKMPDE